MTGSEAACVASVSVEQKQSEERGFRRFARAKNGARAKFRKTPKTHSSLFLCSTETFATQARPQGKHCCFHKTLTVPTLRSRGNKTVSQEDGHKVSCYTAGLENRKNRENKLFA